MLMRSILIFVFASVISADAQMIDVMTYNIRYDNPGDSINAWPNRKQKVADLILKYNPDIIGIQEALNHQLQDLLKSLPGFKMIGVGRDDGRQMGEFSAVLYKADRFDVINEHTFWLSETPDVAGSKSWDAAITRIVTHCVFLDKKVNREFAFFNTHFDHMGDSARIESAKMIKNEIEKIDGEIRAIVTGDFNFTPDAKPYSIITDRSFAELIDPAPEPVGTFCSFKVNSIQCKRIDYIFITNEWNADQYKVITDHDGKHYPSDHLPVMVTLSWTD